MDSSWLSLMTLLSALTTSACAESTWYVAPEGNDSHSGTIDQPFASIQQAQEAVSPGDTVYVRGGVYRISEEEIASRRSIFARVIVLNKSGERDRPITYRAYKGEKPVFDFSNVKPDDFRVSAFYVSGSWIRLVGLDVRGVQVTIKKHTQSICFESQGSHNIFERLTMHDGQAIGIYHVRGSDNLFLNCDAWNNWDDTSEDGSGENVDGFGCHPPRGGTGNVFRGCRAWFNSDDGFDTISAHESVTIEHCWAAYNGYSQQFKPLANGNGFKAGGYGSLPARRVPREVPRHVVRFCVAVGNKASGFYANHHPGGCDWINNSAYQNGTEFNMLGRKADNQTDVDGYDHTLINNLSFGSRYGPRRNLIAIDIDACRTAGNSFTHNAKLIEKDFVSLNKDELFEPRQPDGSLPTIDFLRPAKGSSLIDAGVKTDLADHDRLPTIGAFRN